MVSKYYKISQESLGSNSFKSFQLYLYMYSLFSCFLTYLINKLRRLKIYFLYGEKSLSTEMEIIFFRAVALWKDEIGDEKHEEIPRSSDSLFEKNPKVFELQLFFSNSLKDLVRKCNITGTPAETVDISSVVHRFLTDHFVSLIVTEERVQFWADYQRWFVRIHHNKEAV